MSWTPQTLREFLAASAPPAATPTLVTTERVRLSWRERARRRGAPPRPCTRSACGAAITSAFSWATTRPGSTLFYGAALIGAVTVPVNTRFKAAELAFCLEAGRLKALFTADRFLNIDFVAFLREAEPAVDPAAARRAAAAAATRVVVGEEIPKAALGFDAFLAPGDSVPRCRVRDGRAARVKPTTCC